MCRDLIASGLEFIGVALLVMLTAAALLVLLILFVPLSYKGDVLIKNTAESVRLHLLFFWFFHLIKGDIVYRDKKVNWSLRIAWKQFFGPSLRGKKRKGRKKKSFKKRKRANTRIKEKRAHFCDIMKVWIANIDAGRKFFADSVHKAALSKLAKESKIFFARSMPKSLAGSVRFGFSDPSVTGEAFAVLSAIYPRWGEHLEIVPDFLQKRMEADLHVSGQFHMKSAAAWLTKLLINRAVRSTFSDMKKLNRRVKKSKIRKKV